VIIDKWDADYWPSIYPFMTSTRQSQVDACGRGGGGPAPCGRPHRRLKL